MPAAKIFQFLKQFLFAYRKLILFALIAGAGFLIIPKKPNIKQESAAIHSIIECDRSLYATAGIEPLRKINDLNEIQNEHARLNGIPAYETNEEFINDSARLAKEMVLVRIKDNPLYHIKKLTHSYPYCTPETADLLNTIGITFQEKMREKNAGNYRVIVTSVLRTVEFQNQLMRRNRNASTESAHYFGTTIDITYREFYNVDSGEPEHSYQAAEALRETMLDLREQCRLLVVRERRQPVYHFTVVNCDPVKVSEAKNKTSKKKI